MIWLSNRLIVPKRENLPLIRFPHLLIMNFSRRFDFWYTIFAVTVVSLLVSSCQMPSQVKPISLTAAEPSPRYQLDIGLDAPTWDQYTSEIASFAPPKIDDTYFRIKTSEKVVALTFDDGPVSHTATLLDMLKARKVKATFYVVGNMVRHRPQMLRRMISEGHEIGNHTVTHAILSKHSRDKVKRELQQAHDQIVAATGVAPKTMRPPGGGITKEQKKWVFAEFGYPTIMWSCDPMDWKKPGVSVVAQRTIQGASPGGILLLHDLHKSTVDAVPTILDTLLGQGYRFVTVSELIAMDES